VFIGMSLFALAQRGYIASLNAESPKEALLLGSLLSATDPVATLAVLGQLKVEPQLYSIIFGESVLNDAVAIVLFQTIQRLPTSTGNRLHISLAEAARAMTNFVAVGCGSVLLGAAVGLLTAFVTKRLLVKAAVPTEVNVVISMAYLAFIAADAVGLSGLMAVFFAGAVMSHYAKYNLSKQGQQTTRNVAATMAHLGACALAPRAWPVMVLVLVGDVMITCVVSARVPGAVGCGAGGVTFMAGMVVWHTCMNEGLASPAFVTYSTLRNRTNLCRKQI